MSSTWPMAEMIGYTPVTTFWDDFTIAEAFGGNAVRDTFNRAFDEWKGNYKYLTELVMVLNHMPITALLISIMSFGRMPTTMECAISKTTNCNIS